MKKAEYIQANFRISPVAAAKLNEATEMASECTGRAMIPALYWAEEYDEIKRKIVVLGLSMGWYYLDEIPANLLQDVDGVALIFPSGRTRHHTSTPKRSTSARTASSWRIVDPTLWLQVSDNTLGH